jgi:hypothetical protein
VRMDQDYMDHLVLKNFVFQFISNYFIMFYIAYLRQIECLLWTINAQIRLSQMAPGSDQIRSGRNSASDVCLHEMTDTFFDLSFGALRYPIIGYGEQCEKSCMNALQFKMFFIFTGKTYGLKIKEYLPHQTNTHVGAIRNAQLTLVLYIAALESHLYYTSGAMLRLLMADLLW